MVQPLPMFRFPRTQQPIRVALLGAAVEAIARLPERDRNNTASRVVALLRMMDAHKVPSANRSDLLMGIQFRLEALARLQDQSSYRAWSIKNGTSGRYYVHADLVAAAASAPLLMTGLVASFEPKSFFERVLEISEARGRG
jgi:hypothetical protein